MLMSTMSAPMPSTICAASAITVRIAAEDLNRDRPLFFGVLGVLERAIDPAHESFGADHLGDDEPAAALALHETAERRVGHAGHRRQRDGMVEGDGADFHRGLEADWAYGQQPEPAFGARALSYICL